MKKNILLLLSVFLIFQNFIVFGVDTASRITDREIIEKLAKLEQGQVGLNQRMDSLESSLNQRMDSLESSLNNRMDDMNNRMDDINNTMLTLFGAIIALIVGIFGYIAWDRRTMMKPMQTRIESLEKDIQRDLDLTHSEGSKLTRLINALRELAGSDKKVAELLHKFSLM